MVIQWPDGDAGFGFCLYNQLGWRALQGEPCTSDVAQATVETAAILKLDFWRSLARFPLRALKNYVSFSTRRFWQTWGWCYSVQSCLRIVNKARDTATFGLVRDYLPLTYTRTQAGVVKISILRPLLIQRLKRGSWQLSWRSLCRCRPFTGRISTPGKFFGVCVWPSLKIPWKQAGPAPNLTVIVSTAQGSPYPWIWKRLLILKKRSRTTAQTRWANSVVCPSCGTISMIVWLSRPSFKILTGFPLDLSKSALCSHVYSLDEAPLESWRGGLGSLG